MFEIFSEYIINMDTKKLFYVNSRNRVAGTHSDFTYVLDMKQFNPTHCVVLQANIPKSYYMIQDGLNTFTLTEEGAGSATITIPAGNYNRTTFKSTVSTLLNAGSPNGYTYTITTPSSANGGDNGKYTFTCVGHTLQPTFTFSGDSNVHEALGFEVGEVAFVGGSLESINVIKLTREDTIVIHSDIVGGLSDNILQEVFTVDNSDFTNIVYENHAPDLYEKVMETSNHNSYRFYLTNEDGVMVDLNGLNWSMTLACYKKDNTDEIIRGYLKWRMANR